MELVLFPCHFYHTSDLLDKLCSIVTLLGGCNIHHYNSNKMISHFDVAVFLLDKELALFLCHFYHTSNLLGKLCSIAILLGHCNIQHYNSNRRILLFDVAVFLLGMRLVLFLCHFYHTSFLLDKLCSIVTLFGRYNILHYNSNKTIFHFDVAVFLLGKGLVFFLCHFYHTSDLLGRVDI